MTLASSNASTSRKSQDPICTDGEERLRIRIHPARSDKAPTLIYLPGVQGDWTLIAAFREGLEGRARFVDMTYPRTTTWSLTEYAAAIEDGLKALGIEEGWLLGESFGSQILWEMTRRARMRIHGLIVAGGFVRYPYPTLVRGFRRLMPHLSHRLLHHLLPAYVLYAHLRYAKSPVSIQGARDFVARRTPADAEALIHRLKLIAENDPCEVARSTQIPVHHLYGLFDPIVPWLPVTRWMQRECPSLRATRRVFASDHTILATAAQTSVEQVCQWMA